MHLSGQGRLAQQTLEKPSAVGGTDIVLDLWQTNAATGYDRFGRIGQMQYTQVAASVVDLAYGYDAGSNRVYREDMAASTQGQDLDELYGHDGLSRMDNFQVGALNTNKTAIASGDLAFKQDWGLDQLGNWATFNEDIDGDGDDDLVQDRAANTANEITDIGIAPDGTGADWINPVYDAAGNMTQIPQADTPTDHYDATYDAWNRLVKLENAGTVVATYEYNGVGHRVRKTVDPNGAADTSDTYYNQAWQALEVRKPGVSNPYEQFVYGGSYIDAPFMRYVDADTDGILNEDTDGEQYYLRDASFNVVALLDEAGTALERYRYTPYGRRVVLDADFTPNANNTTGYGQQRGFQGLRHDEESGLIENRRRMLDPTTGRFVQRDPLGYPDGMNGYATYHVMRGGGDPSGMQSWSEWWHNVTPPADIVPGNVVTIISDNTSGDDQDNWEDVDDENSGTIYDDVEGVPGIIDELEDHKRRTGECITTLNLSGHGVKDRAGISSTGSSNWFYGGNISKAEARALSDVLCDDAVINICACGSGTGKGGGGGGARRQRASAQELASQLGVKVCYCTGAVSAACKCDGSWECAG